MTRRTQLTFNLIITIAGLGLALTDFRSARATDRLSSPRPLRVASVFHGSVHTLDPARLTSEAGRGLARNLYGRVIEFDAHGTLTAGLARDFEWRGDTLVLNLEPDERTFDPVTADDVAFSLRRLLMLSSPTARAARDFFCPGTEFTMVDDPCAGITVAGNEVRLGPVRGDLRAQLVRALTRPEFGIVRRAATDVTGHFIIDPRRSTGAYRVLTDDPRGAWRLVARGTLPEGAPADVQLVPVRDHVRLGSGAGEVEFATGEAADAAVGPLPVAYESLPLRVRLLRFTPRAMATTTAAQRARVGRDIADALSDPRARTAAELVPPASHGALTHAQRAENYGRRRAPAALPKTRAFTLAIEPGQYNELAVRLARTPNVALTRRASDADVVLIDADWSWTEDFAVLADQVITKIFTRDAPAAARWMTEYVRTPDRAARARTLREAQVRALDAVSIYPLDARPRRTFATRDWWFHTSPFASEVELRHVRARR